MKETLKSILVYTLIIFFVISQISGFRLPSITIYFWATLLILSLTIMLVCPLLKFLAIKCKFPSFWLMSSILLTGIVYLLNMFMTDFYVESYMFKGLKLGTIEINEFNVSPILAIVFFSIITSLVSGIFREVDRS
jgi:hypothetical protein